MKPIWIHFISFYCLVVVARTSNTMLKRSGEKGHPFLVPDFSRKNFSFLPLSTILAMGLINSFIMFRCIPSISTFVRAFCHEWMLNFIKCFFCLSLEDRREMVFSLLMWCVALRAWSCHREALCVCMYVLVCVLGSQNSSCCLQAGDIVEKLLPTTLYQWLSNAYILYKYSRSKWFVLIGMQVSGRNLGKMENPLSSQSSRTVLALWFQAMFCALCLHVSPHPQNQDGGVWGTGSHSPQAIYRQIWDECLYAML